jgi:hypothetical protein
LNSSNQEPYMTDTATSTIPAGGGYAQYALTYLALGYSPLPLPSRKKSSPPAGYTGRGGKWATEEQVQRWCAERPDGNIALRLPRSVVGIDVDAHKSIAAREAWDALEARLGPLPPGPRSTSRSDGISGIRLFRVVEDFIPVSDMGLAGEVIWFGHRYVVAEPSIHPQTGRPYRWPGTEGDWAALEVANLPELPPAWVVHLRAGAGNERSEYAATEWKSGWAQPDVEMLIAQGIPAGEVQDTVLRDVVWALARQGDSRSTALLKWQAIVSKTTLTRPDHPWTERDFDRHWNGAMAKLASGTEAAEAVVLPGVPEYPFSQITGPLGNLVRSTALPPALVGGAGLAVLAALSSSAGLVMPDGNREVPAVWVPLIAPRSGAKSPALFKRALPPLYELENEARERYSREFAEWKGLPDPVRLVTPRPVNPALVIDDTTLEVVARKLARGTGAALVTTDELSGFLQSIGQYKRSSGDKGRWLSLWSGARWTYERVGADRDGEVGIGLVIERPVVSIVGGIQPHLHHLLGDDDSGQRARWLPHLSTARAVPYDRWTQQGHDGWRHAARRMGRFRGQRRDWYLQGLALDMWEAQGREWKRQSVTEANVSAAAALGKADLYAARVALILAESVACLSDPHPALAGQPVIPEAAMHSAIAIVDYAMAVWRSLPSQERLALSFRDERLAVAVETLRDRLEALSGRKSSRRDLLRNHVAGVRTAKTLNELLAEYERTYPGTVRQEAPEQGGPVGTYVHAPARANSASLSAARAYSPSLSPGDNEGGSSCGEPEIAPAGQRVAEFSEPGVATGDNDFGDNDLATTTVTAGSGDAVARTPPEIDPGASSLGAWPLGTAPQEVAGAAACTGCWKPAETTGNGSALCDTCQFTFEQKGPS